MKKLLVPVITVLALSQSVFAGDGTITAQVERLSVMGTTFGGHKVGNMEIKVKGGFQLPANVYCDTNYITTMKTVDPDRSMLSLLRDAMTLQQSVELIITDNSKQTAYPGRCSLAIVTRISP